MTCVQCVGITVMLVHTVKNLVQVDLHKKLARLSRFLVQVFSCSSFLHRIQYSSTAVLVNTRIGLHIGDLKTKHTNKIKHILEI